LLVRNSGGVGGQDSWVVSSLWLVRNSGGVGGQDSWWHVCLVVLGNDLAGWLSGKTAWRVYEASSKTLSSRSQVHTTFTTHIIT